MIPHRRPASFGLLATLVVALAVGCTATGPTATPTASPVGSAPTTAPVDPTPVPGGSGAPTPGAASPTSQTETEWGRIWDALPPSFPVPPDSIPTETVEGPVSAARAVGAAADAAADFLVAGLTAAGYSIEGRSSPLEDGSIVIDAVGPGPDCRVQVRLTPLSGTTQMIVMYGAGCPFE